MGLADWIRGGRSDPPPASVELDAPELFDDPYPLYARLRRTAPIVPVGTGGYLLTRHADIRALLTHPDFGNAPSRFSSLHGRFRGTRVAADLAANILPFLDRPAHDAPRRLLAAALRARLRGFGAEIDEVATRFVASVPGDECELIADVAGPFTRAVMCGLLGLPESDGPQLTALSDHFFRLFAPLRDADVLAEVNRGLGEFRRLIQARRAAAPPQSLLALMATPGPDGERLPDAQVVDSAILIFADGVENVATGAATVLLAAHRHPEARQALEAGGEDAAAAVSEALRLDSPAQIIPRIARRDTMVRDRAMGEGVPVFLALGSANRDADVFDSPDDFRLARDRAAVLTFGAGRHYCLGASLAEDQIRSLSTATCRLGFEVDATAPPRYRVRIAHRWPAELPLRRRVGAGQTSR